MSNEALHREHRYAHIRSSSSREFSSPDPDLVKISNACAVIQHSLTTDSISCVCQHQSSPLSIQVHYINKNHMELGVDEQLIETWCRRKLILAKCDHIPSSAFEKAWLDLKKFLPYRTDYNQSICLFDEGNNIYFYGLPNIVQHLQQAVQSLIMKYKITESACVMPKSQVIRCIEGYCLIYLGLSRFSTHHSVSKENQCIGKTPRQHLEHILLCSISTSLASRI